MENSRSIRIIIIYISTIFSSNIILTNSKTRNTNSVGRIISTDSSLINDSSIHFNNNSTSSISNRHSDSDCLIIKISDISRNNSHTGSCRINMEQSTSFSVIIVNIIMIACSHIIIANNKARNSESNSL